MIPVYFCFFLLQKGNAVLDRHNLSTSISTGLPRWVFSRSLKNTSCILSPHQEIQSHMQRWPVMSREEWAAKKQSSDTKPICSNTPTHALVQPPRFSADYRKHLWVLVQYPSVNKDVDLSFHSSPNISKNKFNVKELIQCQNTLFSPSPSFLPLSTVG